MKKIVILCLLGITSLCACETVRLDLVHKLPFSREMQTIDDNFVDRTGYKSIKNLLPFITDDKTEDCVYSPASYILAVSALSSVSDGFNNELFGLNNAENDTKSMLESWNFEYSQNGMYDKDYTLFKSCVLHQQVGESYPFDRKKQELVSSNYISSLVSSQDSYLKDAEAFFKDKIGINLKVPDLNINQDSVLTYSAIKMKDYVPNGLGEVDNPFKFKNGEKNVKTYSFAKETLPSNIPYFEGNNYEAFKVNIRKTQLMIVLPKVGVDINSVDVSEAYENFKQSKYVPAYGYIPYFHCSTLGSEITKSVTQNLSGDEILFSKLIKDDVKNDLLVKQVVQSSDFEFNRYGVSGESVTVIQGATKSGPEDGVPKNLCVNRPFYAISLMNNFPIFVNKVTNPQQ